MPAPTFRKEERIVSHKLMEMLFEKDNSRSLSAFPIRVVYLLTEHRAGCAPIQTLISVPKKKFKHAVDRNRVKRQIREAFRLHKHLLYEVVPEDKLLLIAFIWLSDRHFPSPEVERRVSGLIRKISQNV